MKAADIKKTVGTLESVLKKGHVKEVAAQLVKIPKKDRNAILEALEKVLFKKENVGKIFVTGAVPLEDTEQKKIEHAVKHAYKFDHVVLQEKINKKVIGGVKVRVRDEVYDGTIQSKIQKLNNTLTANI